MKPPLWTRTACEPLAMAEGIDDVADLQQFRIIVGARTATTALRDLASVLTDAGRMIDAALIMRAADDVAAFTTTRGKYRTAHSSVQVYSQAVGKPTKGKNRMDEGEIK